MERKKQTRNNNIVMHVKRNICNAVKKKHRVPEFRKTMNTNNKKKFRIYLNGKMQQYNTGQADQIYLISFFFSSVFYMEHSK